MQWSFLFQMPMGGDGKLIIGVLKTESASFRFFSQSKKKLTPITQVILFMSVHRWINVLKTSIQA